MFTIPYNRNIASLHTFFGITITIFVIAHIYNNRKVIFLYLVKKGKNTYDRIIGLTLLIGVIIVGVLIFKDFPHADTLYVMGNEIRSKQINKPENSLEYEIINLDKNNFDYAISVELKQGKNFGHPLFAVWLEDSSGNYLQTLYVSESMGSSTFDGVIKKGRKWLPGIVRRPEALPHWSHQRGIIASDGLMAPLGQAPDLDGVSGATPTKSFELQTSYNLKNSDKYILKLELNQSFDWNQFYSKNAHPEDPIYSGPGNVGQPALVYSSTIDISKINGKKYYFMDLLGHSHFSGQNDKIYDDLDSLTTALYIADRILVTIEKKN